MIEVACPVCSKRMSVHEKHAGKKAKCPICDTLIEVTLTNSPPTSPPSAETQSQTSEVVANKGVGEESSLKEMDPMEEKVGADLGGSEPAAAQDTAANTATLPNPEETPDSALSELQAAAETTSERRVVKRRSSKAVLLYVLVLAVLSVVLGGVILLEVFSLRQGKVAAVAPVAPRPSSSMIRIGKVQLNCVPPVTGEQGMTCGNILHERGWSGVVELRQKEQRYQLRLMPDTKINGAAPEPQQVAFVAMSWSKQHLGGAKIEVHLCNEQGVSKKIYEVVDEGK